MLLVALWCRVWLFGCSTGCFDLWFLLFLEVVIDIGVWCVMIAVFGVVFDGGLGWERVGDCFCWFSLKIRFTSSVVCYGGGRSVI